MAIVHVRVRITQEHINQGRRASEKYCAVANAIVDSDTDISGANAKTDFIEVARHSTERVTKYRTPKIARDFIIDFDDPSKNPNPFTLVLTENDFVSERPRQMRQAQKRTAVAQRRHVAKVQNKPLREVTMDDVKEYYEELGESAPPVEIGKTAVKRIPKPRNGAHRKYAKRESAAGIFQKEESIR